MRDLHPVAWWGWAVGLGAAATATTNPFLLVLLVAVAWTVVVARRGDQPWAASFRLYLVLGAFIVVSRVVFRILLGGSYGGLVLLDLPRIPLPDVVLGIQLLGPVTREALLAGLYDGLRLAALVVCVGAANALANPKRLLASVPSALYEVGTALVVATTVVPQLVDSARRVRAAQRLRPGPRGRVRRLRRFLVPVLEDALERSLRLAAGMDVRGYGRSGGLTPAARRRTGALLLLALAGIATGTYAVLTPSTTPAWLGVPMLLLGVLAAVGGLLSAGRTVTRTRYRPDPWRLPETLVVLSGVTAGGLAQLVAARQVPVAYPALDVVPVVSLLALAAALVGLLPALVAPRPVTAADRWGASARPGLAASAGADREVAA